MLDARHDLLGGGAQQQAAGHQRVARCVPACADQQQLWPRAQQEVKDASVARQATSIVDQAEAAA